MENIVSDINEPLYNNSDLLFNSYYDSSYSDPNLSFNIHHNPLNNSSNPTFELYNSSHNSSFSPIFEMYDPSHDSSDLFLGDLELYETQIGNDMVDVMVHPTNETVIKYNGNIDHNQEECDDSEYEEEEEEGNELKLHEGMEFET